MVDAVEKNNGQCASGDWSEIMELQNPHPKTEPGCISQGDIIIHKNLDKISSGKKRTVKVGPFDYRCFVKVGYKIL